MVVGKGGALASAYVEMDLPPVLRDDPDFGSKLLLAYEQYDVGGAVPVVTVREEPPFAGLEVAALPWAEAGSGSCPRCGARPEHCSV